MKRLLTIIILLTTISCGGGNTTTILPPAAPPPEPDQPPAAAHIVAVYDKSTPEIGTSDGEFFYTIDNQAATNAGQGNIAINDILYNIDNQGALTVTKRLPVIPDAIAIQSTDTWCFKITDGFYTKIYLNNDEYGNHLNNNWIISTAITTSSGAIIAIDTLGRYHNIQDPAMVIMYAGQGGLLIHDVDATNRRATISDATGDHRVAFNTNYFFRADQWVEADGVFYSWNGYIWDGTTLSELATPLSSFVTDWYSERPIIAAIGSRTEFNEVVTYWVECNTGMLYRYTPSINLLEEVILLYQGDGTRDSGLTARDELMPVTAGADGGYLFFTWSGTVWKYNFNDALVSSFAAGVDIWGL